MDIAIAANGSTNGNGNADQRAANDDYVTRVSLLFPFTRCSWFYDNGLILSVQ